MALPREWHIERYRALLQVQVWQLQLSPRLRRRFDSSDLVHDALLKAHQHLEQCRAPTEAQFVNWLLRILANVVIDKIRHEQAQERDPALEQFLQDSLADSSGRLERFVADRGPSPSQHAERHELMLKLAEALEQLPEKQCDAFIQRHLLKLGVAEIAAQLEVTERAVGGLLQRAVRTLRELLGEFAP
jgi:RNA polymerase sigma-70 factor (ECF subfamily)